MAESGSNMKAKWEDSTDASSSNRIQSSSPSASPSSSSSSSSPSPATESADQAMIRERCLDAFKAPDAIMDVNIGKTMKDFINAGGKPQTVVKNLSESYRGYAQMCNLMCGWLKGSAEVEELAVNKMLEDQLKAVIMDKFDPKQADTIFGEGASAPTWLEFMITEADWRSLIYRLSEAHTNCLMLNFAIQRISDLGHQGEIASLTTASTYFGVFNRVLFDALAQICTLDQMSIGNAIADLKKMCCHSQHTYLYVQAVIHGIMNSSPYGHNFKRLSEELEASTLEKGPIVRRMNFLLSDIAMYPVVGASLAAMLGTFSTNPGDIIKLYTEYSKPDPPPVEFLRHPDVFELLIKDLFNPAKVLNPQHKSKYFYVLAYAACVKDVTDAGGRVVDRTALEYTIEGLDSIQPICQRNLFGSELEQNLPLIKTKLLLPVVSLGILHWIRSNFLDPNYYVTTYGALSTPMHLSVLREICLRHPLQHPAILDTLVKTFEMEPDLEALAALDLKRNLLDNIIYVMRCGYVLPVMDTIEHWIPKIDQSLIRYFVVRVLEMVEPPFSPPFVHSLLRIVGSTTTSEALKNMVDSKELVKDFIVHCTTTEYNYDAAHKAILTRLNELFAV